VLVDGRDVHDPAAAALRDHPPRRPLRAQERAVQVDVERVPPVVEGELQERRVVARARVVD
jgi:hypothetical protein